jgi:hypothetical protein
MATEKDRLPLSSEASHAPAPAGAAFLSYASEDAAPAERIAPALRNAGYRSVRAVNTETVIS